MTVDGKVTTKNYTPVDFTSREDKAHLIRQRAFGDAVLVGHGTIENDNVRLGIPREDLRKERIARGQPPYPIRVIVSNKGRINLGLKIFESNFAPIIIFSTTRMPRKTREQLQGKATLYLSQARRVDLRRMLQKLRYDFKVKYVACEGGPALFRSLLEQGLVDQLNLTIAPFLFGGKNAPTLTGVNVDFLPRSVRCSLKEMRVVGDEWKFNVGRSGHKGPSHLLIQNDRFHARASLLLFPFHACARDVSRHSACRRSKRFRRAGSTKK